MKLLQNTAIARVLKTLLLVSILPVSTVTQAETQQVKTTNIGGQISSIYPHFEITILDRIRSARILTMLMRSTR